MCYKQMLGDQFVFFFFPAPPIKSTMLLLYGFEPIGYGVPVSGDHHVFVVDLGIILEHSYSSFHGDVVADYSFSGFKIIGLNYF